MFIMYVMGCVGIHMHMQECTPLKWYEKLIAMIFWPAILVAMIFDHIDDTTD